MEIAQGRHPFDSAQREFYHVISGTGTVRHEQGNTPIEAGDAFIFEPGHCEVEGL